jgi:hypothetical protein
MRFAWITVSFALTACHETAPEVVPDAPPSGGCTMPTPTEGSCSQTCGNGQLDQCWRVAGPLPHCPLPLETLNETCDGPIILSCEQLNYFGGTATCGSTCFVDESACDPCASTVACTQYSGLFDRAVAPSGARTALIANSGITFVEGSTEVAHALIDAPQMAASACPAVGSSRTMSLSGSLP